MRRWNLRILVCFALGFATTALVATMAMCIVPHLGPMYASSMLRPRSPSAGEGTGHLRLTWAVRPAYTQWTASARPDLVIPLDDKIRLVGFGNAPSWSHRVLMPWLTGDAPWPLAGQRDGRMAAAAGWPCRAMWWDWRGRPPNNSRSLHPIFGGTLADTSLYATAWFTLLFAPGPVRSHFRRRRGLCPACGYSLSGLPPGAACPECGKGGLA